MLPCLEIRGGYRKYDEITFLKGFSITTIVLMHMIQSYMRWLPNGVLKLSSFGGTGVHVFFFCSGFGLCLSYLHKETGFFEFVKKRFLKVYFPYVFVVLIVYFLPTVVFEGNRLIALLSHVFLFKMFIPQYETSLGPFWFISTLFQFYFLFVFLCKIKTKIGNKPFFIICLLASILWWIATAITGLNNERIWGSFFLQYLWEFSLGMIVSDYLFRGKTIRIPYFVIIILAVVGLAIEGILGLKGGWFGTFNDIPALLGYASLGILLFNIKAVRSVFIWLGGISYEWYLVHMMVFSMVFLISSKKIIAVLALVMSLVVAFGYNKLIQLIRRIVTIKDNNAIK